MDNLGSNVVSLEERVRALREELAIRSLESTTIDLLALQDTVRRLALVLGIAELLGHPLSSLDDIHTGLDRIADTLRDIAARLG